MKFCLTWICMLVLLVGCASHHPNSLGNEISKAKHPKIQVVQINPTLAVPTKVTYGLDQYIQQAIHYRLPHDSKPLIVEYKITHFHENKLPKSTSLFKRLSKSDNSEIHIDVTFKNQDGKILDHIQAKSTGGAQLIGSAIDQALKRIAKDIAQYTKSVASQLT